MTDKKDGAPEVEATSVDPVEAGPVPEGGAPPYPPEDASDLAPVPAEAPVWEGGDPGTATPPPPEADPVDDDETPAASTTEQEEEE